MLERFRAERIAREANKQSPANQATVWVEAEALEVCTAEGQAKEKFAAPEKQLEKHSPANALSASMLRAEHLLTEANKRLPAEHAAAGSEAKWREVHTAEREAKRRKVTPAAKPEEQKAHSPPDVRFGTPFIAPQSTSTAKKTKKQSTLNGFFTQRSSPVSVTAA
eukprot:TRINITY_DN4001_c0_g3_i1.p2 TRINITY_DN4001_c0_g3~~TRINITY_DN4001_c0_g3_i1.p2  ORF type:complete len:183 (-),score=39.22 TRINITY_DN4001_c0_g3_i1:206-700(-)